MKIKEIIVAGAIAVSALNLQAELVDDIKDNVRDNWSKISERCQKVQELVDELPKLPDNAWFSKDKKDQLEKIQTLQKKIREELLSVDTQKVLEKAEKFGKKISQLREDIVALKEERSFASQKDLQKIDEKIQKKQDEIQRFTAHQAAEMEKVKKELASIGLHSDGNNLNALLSMADRADVIDNVIVAKSVGEILRNLREILKDGDTLSAKRYYGVYFTLAEVHILCYEQYLEKSRYGKWRKGLAQLESNATAAIELAQNSIASGTYNELQCKIFRERTIPENNRLLTGISVYRKLLDAHEVAIEKKLVEVRKQRDVAKSLYDTVSGMVSFTDMLKSTQDDFSAVMELELPDIAIVDYFSVTEEQLNSITKMLDR